jgi:hypothetical protein
MHHLSYHAPGMTTHAQHQWMLACPLLLQARTQPWGGAPGANSDDQTFKDAAQNLVPNYYTLMTGVAFETGVFDCVTVHTLHDFDAGTAGR